MAQPKHRCKVGEHRILDRIVERENDVAFPQLEAEEDLERNLERRVAGEEIQSHGHVELKGCAVQEEHSCFRSLWAWIRRCCC